MFKLFEEFINESAASKLYYEIQGVIMNAEDDEDAAAIVAKAFGIDSEDPEEIHRRGS